MRRRFPCQTTVRKDSQGLSSLQSTCRHRRPYAVTYPLQCRQFRKRSKESLSKRKWKIILTRLVQGQLLSHPCLTRVTDTRRVPGFYLAKTSTWVPLQGILRPLHTHLLIKPGPSKSRLRITPSPVQDRISLLHLEFPTLLPVLVPTVPNHPIRPGLRPFLLFTRCSRAELSEFLQPSRILACLRWCRPTVRTRVITPVCRMWVTCLRLCCRPQPRLPLLRPLEARDSPYPRSVPTLPPPAPPPSFHRLPKF